MDVISIICIIIATVSVCVILIQSYSIYENYDNIKEFNLENAALEYSKSTGGSRTDRRVYDPNDNVYDVKQKWRCEKRNQLYLSVSIFGFLSDDRNTIKYFTSKDECILYTFTNRIFTDIFNPCLPPNEGSDDCKFLKSIL
ncbi:IMV MP/virus entry [Sea otter poxvirus]|uniref:IMV MP/virus entry n=1 Tax=Sea otter poxvirus TaxID=1416741 RepID=A0A2U9QHU4_9POXV|nr:IMV MP/virus entry [Sea otter poxvirus]AWU47163.1 IMV MP/virus entry [Sea otter poxvirus]